MNNTIINSDTFSQNTHNSKELNKKKDEPIISTSNLLKELRKDIPIGADVIYITISKILANEEETYIFDVLIIIIFLIMIAIGIYQYCLIYRNNEWYYNAIYSCECNHCKLKKTYSIYNIKFKKSKLLAILSAFLHNISFLTFVYFHEQPFKFYNLYNQSLSFVFLIFWSFINGIIHKIIKINVPKYIITNMNYLKNMKNQKKKKIVLEYKKKLEECYMNYVHSHINYIKTIECNHIAQDCMCNNDIVNLTTYNKSFQNHLSINHINDIEELEDEILNNDIIIKKIITDDSDIEII